MMVPFLVLILLSSPAISLAASAEPLPPVEVHLTDPSKGLMIQDNETQIVSLTGIVQTNYPGLKVDVALNTICNGFTTNVDPAFMSFRGKAKMDFSILVEVFIGNESARGCLGTLSTNIMITYPGGNAAEQTTQSFSITVQKEDLAANDTGQGHGSQRRSAPNDMDLALNGLGLLAIAAVGATALVLRRRLVPRKGRRGP